MGLSLFPVGMGLEVGLGLLVVGIVLSVLGGIVSGAAAVRDPFTRRNTTLITSEKGAKIPWLIGTFRVGHVFAWVGKLNVINVKKGFLGSVKTKVTSQPGWHILCVGPGDRLIKIYQQGIVIYPIKTLGEKELYRTSAGGAHPTPSGTKIACLSGAGAFRIYWGDPANPPAAPDPLWISLPTAKVSKTSPQGPGIGVASNFNNVMSIMWCNKGNITGVWPQIDYEIEVRPFSGGAYLTNASSAWVAGVAGPARSPLVPYPPDVINNGADPIHCIAEIMCNTYPQGTGIPVSGLDMSFFNAMQAKLALEGSSQVCSNVLAQNGDKASKVVQDILSDIGGVIPQVGDKIIIYLVRQESSVPSIPNDAMLPALPESIFLQGPQPVNRTTYLFKDRQFAFRDNDITIDADQDTPGIVTDVQTPLNSVIDSAIALEIVDRKQVENLLLVKTFKITGGRQMRALSPGQVFQAPGLGQLRIVSVEKQDLSSTVKLECITDIYAPIAGAGGSSTRPLYGGPLLPDAALYAWTVPYELMGALASINDCWVHFFPIKEDPTTTSNDIQVTFDTGGSPVFNFVQTNDAIFIQGLLTQQVQPDIYWTYYLPVSSDTYQLEINITCGTMTDIDGAAATDADLDFDVSSFPDLTNYPERWRNGENCCAIQAQDGTFREVIYFKSITPSVNNHCYYLNGILRHRIIKTLNPNVPFDAAGRVVLFRKTDIAPVLIPNPTTGQAWTGTNAMKAQSYSIDPNGNRQANAGNAAVTTQLFSSFTPLPPANFRSADADSGFNRYTWDSGGTGAFTFKWTNRPTMRGVGQTAGTQLAGIALSPVPVPFEGVLVVQIYTWTGNVLVRTFNVAAGNSLFYNGLSLAADLGSSIVPGLQFKAKYQVNVNGIVGPQFEQIFTAR